MRRKRPFCPKKRSTSRPDSRSLSALTPAACRSEHSLPSCSSLFSNSFGSAHMMSADTSEAAISDQCRLSSTTMPQSTWDALPTQLKKGFQASCSICLISLVIQERYSPLSCLW